MSLWYRFLYRFGITPWEADSEVLGAQIARLVAAEEEGRQPPYGAALDLGCGRGRWSIALAQRGWDVTGVDVVPRAIAAARQRAEAAGVDVAFHAADVAALRDAGVGSRYSLFLDVECFNHLDDAQRTRVAREIDAVAAPDAVLMMLAWKPGRRGPLPPGLDRDELRERFPGWQITHDEPYDGEMPGLLENVAPRWYRLQRRRATAEGPAS